MSSKVCLILQLQFKRIHSPLSLYSELTLPLLSCWIVDIEFHCFFFFLFRPLNFLFHKTIKCVPLVLVFRDLVPFSLTLKKREKCYFQQSVISHFKKCCVSSECLDLQYVRVIRRILRKKEDKLKNNEVSTTASWDLHTGQNIIHDRKQRNWKKKKD